MHREHPIKNLGRDEVVLRANELDAHDRSFYPAD
jgi:hypothetical protein